MIWICKHQLTQCCTLCMTSGRRCVWIRVNIELPGGVKLAGKKSANPIVSYCGGPRRYQIRNKLSTPSCRLARDAFGFQQLASTSTSPSLTPGIFRDSMLITWPGRGFCWRYSLTLNVIYSSVCGVSALSCGTNVKNPISSATYDDMAVRGVTHKRAPLTKGRSVSPYCT